MRCRSKSVLLTLTVLAVMIAAHAKADAAVIVVDQKHPAADDANSGTAEKPLKTIGKAVAMVKPGDTVLVKAGLYRESVLVKTSGTREEPITLKAAPGQRVIVSGAEPISDWEPCPKADGRGNANTGKLFVAQLATDRTPTQIFQNNHPLRQSRFPDTGWHTATGGTTTAVADKAKLTQSAGAWEGASIVFRYGGHYSRMKSTVTGYDPATGTVTHEKHRNRTKEVTAGKDLYCLTNAVAAISGPGQWAVDTRQKPYHLFVWPHDNVDPNTQLMETPVRGGQDAFAIGWGPNVGYLTIDGFEVQYVEGGNGIGTRATGGHHVTIQNCVCIAAGIRLWNQTDCTVRRCLQMGCKGNGLRLIGCKSCTIEECEVYYNGADAITISHKSDGCRILRNYIHDQWWDWHPDGLQTYRDVTKLHVEGNLLFNCGQGFMVEGTDGCVFTNNMIVGAHHSGLILGHKTTHNFAVTGNTIAFTGFQAIVYTGRGTSITDNVLLTGGDRKLIRRGSEEAAITDRNLVWMAPGGNVQYDVAEGTAPHSKVGDPTFRCAPPLNRQAIFYIDGWGDKTAQERCTLGSLCLGRRPLEQHFAVGDHIEISFDGVVRKVTAIDDDRVSFTPPLTELHHHAWEVIVNWRDQADFAWDLRLADDSPGKGMSKSKGDVGSSIDIQAYMRGDFNGDGARDLPTKPKAATYKMVWPE